MSHKMNGNFIWKYRFLLAINFIAFWGVAPCNWVEYMNVVGEYVT